MLVDWSQFSGDPICNHAVFGLKPEHGVPYSMFDLSKDDVDMADDEEGDVLEHEAERIMSTMCNKGENRWRFIIA